MAAVLGVVVSHRYPEGKISRLLSGFTRLING